MAQALWVSDLMSRVTQALGFPVLALRGVEIERGGEVSVKGVARAATSVSYEFEIEGPFDVEGAMPAVDPLNQMLFPFGTEFEPPVPESPEFQNAEEFWRWAQPQIPVVLQPKLAGFDAILEKKGGDARLWFAGHKGVDQVSKFVDVRKFLIDLPDDFVVQASVGLEKDGQRLPQSEQEALLAPGMQVPDGAQLSIACSDLLYLNKDLHAADSIARHDALTKVHKDAFSACPNMQLLPTKRAADEFEIGKAVDWARAFPTSRGVSARTAGSPYPLTGKGSTLAAVAASDPPNIQGIYKADVEQRIATGVILRPNFQDAQGDVMSPEEVVKAAHYYLENARVLGLRHGKDPGHGPKPLNGAVLESYIAPADFKLGAGQVKKGDWVLSVRVDDQGVWAKIVSGEYEGFSVGGTGAREDR